MTINIFIAQPMNRHIEEIQEERARIEYYIKRIYEWFQTERYTNPDIQNKWRYMFPKVDCLGIQEKIEINVVNPIERQNVPRDTKQLWYLGQDIADLENCELVIFSNDWERSSNCRIIREIVQRYGMASFKEEDIRSLAVHKMMYGWYPLFERRKENEMR